MLNSLVDRIIQRRKELKISQVKLAERCGLKQSVIARMEIGETIPTISTLEKIMEVLGLEIVCKEKDTRPPYIKRWDDLQFTCYWRDEPVSEVLVKGNRAYIKRFVERHPLKQIFYADEMDVNKLSEILRTRCWQDDRADIDLHLKKLGLSYYDPLEIVKRTHGVSYNDFLWIQFRGEHLRWKDVAPKRFRYVEN